jgi:hypothetical protein
MMVPKKRQDDRWALAYINAAYVQPILEAVDDDGTGFVSVKEVNTFVAERPDNWRFIFFTSFIRRDTNPVPQSAALDRVLGCW